jgi:hypothetical protein
MSPEQWENLQGIDKKIAKADQLPDNPGQVYAMKLAMARNPTKAGTMDMSGVFGKMSDHDANEISKAQLEYVNKGPADTAPGILTKEDAFNTVLTKAGILKTDEPGAMALKGALDEKVRAWETQTGKKAQPDDISKMGNEMILNQVRHHGMLWNSKLQPAYTIQPGDEDKQTLPLSDLAARDPQAARQADVNLRQRAGDLGLVPSAVSGDQYDRALAQAAIAQDRQARGDVAGQQRAMARIDKILTENRQPPPVTTTPQQRHRGSHQP